MSEAAAVYRHLVENSLPGLGDQLVSDCLRELSDAGFDIDAAIAEISGFDERLAGISTITELMSFATTHGSVTLSQVADAFDAQHPGLFQAVVDYCVQQASELEQVAGGGNYYRQRAEISTFMNLPRGVQKDISIELKEVYDSNHLLNSDQAAASSPRHQDSGLGDSTPSPMNVETASTTEQPQKINYGTKTAILGDRVVFSVGKDILIEDEKLANEIAGLDGLGPGRLTPKEKGEEIYDIDKEIFKDAVVEID